MIQSFSNVFEEILGSNPKIKQRVSEYRILDFWSTIVSPQAAKHSSPEKINKGVLFVNTSSGTWAQQLSLSKTKILKELNQKLPEAAIKDIRFRPSGIGRQGNLSLAETNQTQRTKRKCRECGVEWLGDADICHQCARIKKQEREISLLKAISRSPWIKFEALKKEIPDLDKEEFEKKKRYRKSEIYDTIKKSQAEIEQGRKVDRAKLRALVCDYVFLQTEISPAELDEQIIKNAIDPTVYAAIKDTEGERKKKKNGRKRSKQS